MNSAPMTASDKKYQAESDARTLADAEVIKGDLSRFKAAQSAAKKMANEARDKARAMTNISHGKATAMTHVRGARS